MPYGTALDQLVLLARLVHEPSDLADDLVDVDESFGCFSSFAVMIASRPRSAGTRQQPQDRW